MRMNFSHKIILNVLIIATGLNCSVVRTKTWPISLNLKGDSNAIRLPSSGLQERRFARQVVQPSWLNIDPEPAVDAKVHVNRKALLEAEEIRKTIQKAVKEDTFVVTADEQYPNDMNTFPITHPYEVKNKINPTHGSPNWYTQLQYFWYNLTQNLLKVFRT